MAEGLLRGLGEPRFAVASAGTVATSVRSEAITVMAKLAISISGCLTSSHACATVSKRGEATSLVIGITGAAA